MIERATWLTAVVLDVLGPVYSLAVILFLFICIVVYWSPLGRVRIGGASAKPLLSKWRWYTITLTTTLAVGILMWGSAEPLYHLHSPATALKIQPNSSAAVNFSLGTMFLHWSFLPYAIYTVAAVMFALMYYNRKQPFRLGSLFYPLFGANATKRWSKSIDALCLFCLVAGMSASLGSGILGLEAGLKYMFTLGGTWELKLFITLGIVAAFVLSAITGLLKGIRFLAAFNIILFFALWLFLLCYAPLQETLAMMVGGLKDFAIHLDDVSLYSLKFDDSWAHDWTMMYWANWLAWTPITALFLGRLCLGYTVRQVILVNLVLPSITVILWLSVLSSTSIQLDQAMNGNIFTMIQSSGNPGDALFSIFDGLPLATITGLILLLTAFLSYVTAADSNTSAMSGLCSNGISPESPEPKLWLKVVWGVLVGTVALTLLVFSSIDGIRIMSNIGGIPALFICLLVVVGLIKLLLNPKAATFEEEVA